MFLKKLKEATFSVMPITLIILILSFTPLLDLSIKELLVFICAAIILIVGIALFSIGSEMAMEPMGEKIGSSLIKSKKVYIALIVCFVMGLLITIAEPDLSVLADTVKTLINPKLLIITVSLGVGIFLVLAVMKIIFKRDLPTRLIFYYLVVFAVATLIIAKGNGTYLPLAFDSGGVTTGPITVPFIMALGLGIAKTVGGRESKENSFGLVALCSIGPILVVSLFCLSINGGLTISASYEIAENLGYSVLMTMLNNLKEVAIALALIFGVFLVLNFIFIKLSKHSLHKIGLGILFTLLGLVFFLSAAQIGFMPIGYKIGYLLASAHPAWIIIFGFILGVTVVLAEPAVAVLTKQVEEVTTGAVSKRSMLIALSIGVGLSICLSMIRIYFGFSLLYYIVPGYLLSLGLSFFVPKVYTSIAFDAGGVASGPLTSSFILPLAIGATVALQGNNSILELAYGIIAMVAMTPLITIQLLGFKSIIKHNHLARKRLKKMELADDELIINFK